MASEYIEKLETKIDERLCKMGYVRMFGEINQKNVSNIRRYTFEAFYEHGHEEITFLIDSEGGQMMQMRSFRNDLILLGVKKRGIVVDRAYSAAGAFLAFCDVRQAFPFASIVFHYGSFGRNTERIMRPGQLNEIAENMRALVQDEVSTIAKHLGLTTEKVTLLMEVDEIIPASRAKELGIISEIIPSLSEVSAILAELRIKKK